MQRRYKRFTAMEMEKVQADFDLGMSNEAIGRQLGRTASSIANLRHRLNKKDKLRKPEQVSTPEEKPMNEIKKPEQVFVDAEFFEPEPMKEIKRTPTLEELGMIALLWSGVCLVLTVVYKIAVLL